MRAEIVTRNAEGIFSGSCPHCGERIRADDLLVSETLACPHCIENIEVRSYGSTVLFLRAPVKVLPRPPRAPRMIDPDTYCDY